MTAKPHTTIPDDVRRFVLTSIVSVPHLEALLLLRRESCSQWACAELAKRLYLAESVAEQVLSDLHEAGLLECGGGEPSLYRFHPRSEDLLLLVGRLADTYAARLVEVTNLIHSKDERRALQFADAFKLRKDS